MTNPILVARIDYLCLVALSGPELRHVVAPALSPEEARASVAALYDVDLLDVIHAAPLSTLLEVSHAA